MKKENKPRFFKEQAARLVNNQANKKHDKCSKVIANSKDGPLVCGLKIKSDKHVCRKVK